MVAKASIQLGGASYQFEVEEKSELDTLNKIITFANPRRFCNICNGDRTGMYFTTNKDKEGNTYVNVKCKCGARSKLGSYKTGGFFWHEFEVYVKPTEKTESAD